jgi:subtilase family serine protease
MKKLLAGFAACALLAGCGGGSHAPAGSVVPAPAATPGATNNASAIAWGSDALQGATYVGPAQIASMSIDVDVKMRDQAGLSQYAAQAGDPKSPLYRQFLTPDQIAQRFGADDTTYAAVATYFEKFGLHVGGWKQHLSLFVKGSQSQFESALGVKFGVYERGGTQFIGINGAPHFSANIGVRAIRNAVVVQRYMRDFVPVQTGNNTLAGYSPAQIQQVFDYVGAYHAGYTGKGISIGIIGTGPISAADVPAFGRMFNVPVAPVRQVSATDQGVAAASPPPDFPYSTGLQTPPPVTNRCLGGFPNCNPEDGEAQIDTEQAAALAPDANVLFYIAYNPAECYQPGPGGGAIGGTCPAGPNGGLISIPAIGLDLADDEIEQAISDNTADILSLSYGAPESYAAGYYFAPNDPSTGFGSAEFAALAAEGIAVFVSSGDSGAEGCARIFPAPPTANQPCVSYPAVDPNVVSVGGVTTPLDQFGRLTNQITGWGTQTSGGAGGSGGGVSLYIPQPSWQAQLPGIQGSMRNQPDASLEGDSATGVSIIMNADPGLHSQQVLSVGGTSVAAPEMAAMWALVLQACKAAPSCGRGGVYGYRLGNPAPILYSFYGKTGTGNLMYSHVFYDVVYGDNSQLPTKTGPTPVPSGAPNAPGFNAGPGYDLVTGLGVPFARALIQAVTGQ